MAIKIAITDDHPIVIDGLTMALDGHPEIMIIGGFSCGADLLMGLSKSIPDVLLLDIQLPDKTGYELVPLLLKEYPDLKILILSGMESSPYIKEIMQKGCKGYLLKSTTNKHILVEAITEVYHGGIYLDKGLKEQLLNEMFIGKRKRDKIEHRITQREKDVLKLVAAECSNQEIADRLFISLRTVETHRYNLFQKLNVKNTAGLVRLALSLDL